jgi:hypothetical protein
MSRKPSPEDYNNEHTRATPDEFDETLQRDNERRVRGNADQDYQLTRESGAGLSQPHVEFGDTNRQKDRTGQAQSPRELNLDQPEKKKEGHRLGAGHHGKRADE